MHSNASSVIALCGLIVLCLTLTSAQQEDLEKFKQQNKPYIDTISAKNILGYGESCSVETEQKRKTIGKNILRSAENLSIPPSNNPQDLKNWLNGIFTDMGNHIYNMASIPGMLCNSFDGLECFGNGTCGCIAQDESLGFKASYERKGDKCVMSGGSVCAPESAIKKQNEMLNLPKITAMCDNCVVKSTRETCSEENMKEEVQRVIQGLQSQGKRIDRSNMVQVILEETRKGFCVCGGSWLTSSVFLVLGSLVALAISKF